MHLSGRPELNGIGLRLFDDLMSLRDSIQHNIFAQALSILYYAGLLLVAILLFVYWCYSANYLLNSASQQLLDAEIEPLRWDHRLRQFLINLIHPGCWMAL